MYTPACIVIGLYIRNKSLETVHETGVVRSYRCRYRRGDVGEIIGEMLLAGDTAGAEVDGD